MERISLVYCQILHFISGANWLLSSAGPQVKVALSASWLQSLLRFPLNEV